MKKKKIPLLASSVKSLNEFKAKRERIRNIFLGVYTLFAIYFCSGVPDMTPLLIVFWFVIFFFKRGDGQARWGNTEVGKPILRWAKDTKNLFVKNKIQNVKVMNKPISKKQSSKE